MIDEPKITLKVKLDNIFQMISNKVTSWSQTPSNDKYPSEKLVKDSLDEKISKSNISGLIKNDGTVDTNIYISASDECGTFTELKALIDNAQNNDTIILEKDYKNSGNEELIGINNKNLKIIGNGHIIDADNKSRIFEIYNVSAFYIVDIIFINGIEEDANGGAIYCDYPITISNCSFVNCRGWWDGGAISGDDLIVKNCIFINCEARSGEDRGAGGAIYSYTANIYDSIFINNFAETDGGAIYLVNSSGIVKNCFFKNNTAGKNGGGIGSYQSNYKVYNCTFENSSLYNTTNVDYLTEHQSLSGYLQTSDVKDNLTSTDIDKPLSAKQGKELKTLIDSKEDNIEIFNGSVVRTSSTSAFLKAYTTSSILVGKIILYKVPNISSIEWTTNVALDYYMNNQTTSFYRKYVYKNGVQLTFGDIESNSWILLAYNGTISNGQWNLISSSSYVETKKLPTNTSDLNGDYLQTQQGNQVFDVTNNTIEYGNQALTFNTSNNKFYYNKLEGSGEIATIYDINKISIKNFSNNETIINKQYNTSKEIKFHYSRTNTTDCDGYIQIGNDNYGIIVGIVETETTSSITLQDKLSGDGWRYGLSNLDDTNSFDISLRLELDTQNIESLQLGDSFHYHLILTIDEINEQSYSAEPVISKSDEVDIFLNRNYISKVVQDTNSRITDLTFSTDGIYVEKRDMTNNSTNFDSLLADVIDYGMDNDSEW